MNDIVQEFQAAFCRQRQRLRRYTALLVALALVTTLFVNWQLHSDGIAKTADYQCNLEEHEHTADCYPLVLVCGYEEGQPEDGTAAAPEEDSLSDESFSVQEPVFVPHVHTDDCYQDVVTEVPVLTCYQEEHLHTDDCFDPEDGTLICGLFEHTHSEEEGCYAMEYETTRELVCGYEEGELVEEPSPAYTDAAAFADAVAVLPVVDEPTPSAEPVLHHHTEACYAPDYTAAPLCGLEEHHHTVNCLADPLADVEDESDWLAKTSTSLSGDWSADLLTVAQSQLGYAQSEKNFELDADDGETVRHYTRYGQWYGNPYGSWDVMFLSYCLNYAGIPQSAIPQRAGTQALRSDLRATGYLMDPQSIPAAQQDAIALCDEGLPEEESFADADADDLGFADSASSFCSIRPGDIVFYNTTVTETVTAENEPQIETLSLESDADADTGDTALSSLNTPADPPRTEQRTTVSETLGIVSEVDEAADILTVISGNVNGKVDSVQVNISQLTGLISLAAVQEEETFRADEDPVELAPMTPGGSITSITVKVNDQIVTGNRDLTDGDNLRLDYDYAIPANTIQPDGNRTLTYKLPEGIYLSSAFADRPITQGTKQVGTFNVSKDGTVTLTFNDDFQANQPFTGSFGLEAKVTTSQIGDSGTITFPGTDVTITVHDKTSLDLEKKHLNYAEENGKTYAYYRLTVTSKDGWNEKITIHDLLDNSNASNGLSGSYDKSSFVLTDKNGNVITGHSPTFSGDGFEVKDLPGLEEGGKYILTYRVEITNKSKDGSGSFSNSAWVDEDNKKPSYAHHGSYIAKDSRYDPDDGYLYWTVKVCNPDKGDLNGTTLTDALQTGGAEIVGDVTVTEMGCSSNSWTASTFDTITPANGSASFDYTFKKSATAEEYQFTYKTKVPADTTKVENKAELDHNGGHYEADKTGTVSDRNWDVSKKAPDSLTETSTQDLYTGAWDLSTPVPNSWKSYIIKDQIRTPDSKKGGDHYGIADELDEELKEKLTFTCVDGTTLSYAEATAKGIGIQFQYYRTTDAKDSGKLTLPDASTHVQCFTITLTNKGYTGTSAIKSLSVRGYHTYISVSGIAEGTKVDFTNKANGHEAKFSYTKEKPAAALTKGVAKEGEDDLKKVGEYGKTITTKYKNDKDNFIYYQLALNIADWTRFPDDVITVTDQLDSRVQFVEAQATFQYGPNTCSPFANPNYTTRSDHYDLTKPQNFSATANGSTVEFKLSNLQHIHLDETAKIQAILIRYKVKVVDEAWTSDPNKELETYQNTAVWGTATDHAEATFTRKITVLEKNGTKNKSKNDSRASYTVTINPTAKDLVPGSDTVTLTDTLTVEKGFTARLDLDSVKLYDYPKQDGDLPLPDTMYEFYYTSGPDASGQDTHTMKLVLPDSQAFVLEYDYVTDAQHQKVTLKNTAEMAGAESSSDTTTLDAVNGWADVHQGLLTLHKVDSTNQKLGLPGAVFTLYKFDKTTGQWETTGTPLPQTGADGSLGIYVGANTFVTMDAATLYKLVETTEPEGYKRSETPHYFIWTQDQTQSDTEAYNAAVNGYTGADVPDAASVTIYKHGTAQELYLPNERSQLTIQKFWVDANGKTLTGTSVPEASVTVHLYRYPAGQSKAERDTAFDEVITLSRENQWTFVYTDLAAGYFYYIEEPSTGARYEVSYSASNTTGVQNGGLLTLTNKQKPEAPGYELPSTGGAGTTLYTAVGGAMVLAALVCGFCQKRRRERRAD